MLGLLTCSATADDAFDKACALAAVSRLTGKPGATVEALRILDPPRLFSAAQDTKARVVEVDMHTPSNDATYVFICKTERERVALEMIGMRPTR